MNNGTLGWAGVAGFVLLYDTWAIATGRETLSGAFGRNLGHPGWRWLVLPLWLVTSLHLFGRLPSKYDPFSGYGSLLVQAQRKRRSPLDGPVTRV